MPLTVAANRGSKFFQRCFTYGRWRFLEGDAPGYTSFCFSSDELRFVDKCKTIFTTALGAIHRPVGQTPQRRDIAGIFRINGDADADAGQDLLPRICDRLANIGDDFFRNRDRFLPALQVSEEQDKFVTANAADGIAGAHTVRQARGNCLQ